MDPEKAAVQDEEKGKAGKALATGSPGSDDPSSKMWNLCLEHSAKHDAAMAERWKNDMDGILIYTGVFSATVAAFLIESYKYLKPDPAEVSSRILLQVTRELAGISNGDRLTPPTIDAFKAPRFAIHVNILWFLSLCASLACGLGATLVQQWIRRYLRLTQRADYPVRRARIRTFLYNGMQEFHIRWVVENVSVMLHGAIFLFFAGLVEFLFAINDEVADVVLVAVVGFAVLYILLTCLPIIFHQCPFQTPLTSIFWYAGHLLAICFMFFFTCSNHVRVRIENLLRTVGEGIDTHLMGKMTHKTELDKHALQLTLSMCRNDNELEAFVDAIPGYLQVDHDVDTHIDHDHDDTTHIRYNISTRIDDIGSLLKAKGKELPLGHRLVDLFSSCTNDHRRMDEGVRRRRAVTCSRAIWEMSKAFLSLKASGPTLDLPKSIGHTLQRLTSDPDVTIAFAALRTISILKRALQEQFADAEAKKDTVRSKDTAAMLAEVVIVDDSLSLAAAAATYQAGSRNVGGPEERLNDVKEFTSNMLELIPKLGKPSHMDLEETRLTIEELCHGLSARDFPPADQEQIADVMRRTWHAHPPAGTAVSTGKQGMETYHSVLFNSTRRLVSTLDTKFSDMIHQ